jgi:hypothetical protein
VTSFLRGEVWGGSGSLCLIRTGKFSFVFPLLREKIVSIIVTLINCNPLKGKMGEGVEQSAMQISDYRETR